MIDLGTCRTLWGQAGEPNPNPVRTLSGATVRGNFQGHPEGHAGEVNLGDRGAGGAQRDRFIRTIDLFAATVQPVIVTPYLLLEYRTSPTIKANLNHPPLVLYFCSV
jgi:hypothetical protein